MENVTLERVINNFLVMSDDDVFADTLYKTITLETKQLSREGKFLYCNDVFNVISRKNGTETKEFDEDDRILAIEKLDGGGFFKMIIKSKEPLIDIINEWVIENSAMTGVSGISRVFNDRNELVETKEVNSIINSGILG